MNVLVTGATGFIGSHVVELLLLQGYSVITTSRSAYPINSWNGKTKHIPFDIESPTEENLFELFQKPDLVIHLAWSDLTDYFAESHITKQLPSHMAFLKNLIQHGATNLTVAGTCLEYGLQNGHLNENTPTIPVTLYGQAKVALHLFLQITQKRYSFNLKWLRYFYMYGERQNQKSIIPLLDVAIERGDAQFNMSGGEQLRDYLSVDQVAQCTILLAMNRSVEGAVNVCSGIPISIRELVEKRIEEKQSDILLNLGYYPYTSYEPMQFWGDNSIMNRILST